MSASEERGTTGETCQKTGTYYCVRHHERTIHISKGETFPPCNEGSHATTWILKK